MSSTRTTESFVDGGHLDVVTLGESMALFLGSPAMPMADSREYRRSVAGAESNVAIGLARLGAGVGWFGRLGDDPLGDAVLRTIRGEGVDVSRVVSDPAPTGLLVRTCQGERVTEVVYHRDGSAGSRLSGADVDASYIATARTLHLTGITPLLSETAFEAVHAAVDAAVAAGTTVVFDPNLREHFLTSDAALDRVRGLVKRSDIVLAGHDEARTLSGADGNAMASWFLDNGCRLLVVKHGAEGSWATDGSARWEQSAFPVTPVDVVGAGDAFAAGFLAAWLDDEDVPGCLRSASTVAALAVQTPGDFEGCPTRRARDVALHQPNGTVLR